MEYIHEYSEEERSTLQKEFQRIGTNHYLDHAGTTLYSEQQLKQIFDNFSTNFYCNPHTSKSTEDLIDQVRYAILQHFNTTAEEYSVVFTSGATQSLKLVAECFEFKSEHGKCTGHFAYLQDNHTSVLGMREIVKTDTIRVVEHKDFMENCKINVNNNVAEVDGKCCNSLLVYPAQCNFSGFKYPLAAINKIQKNQFKYKENQCDDTNGYVCLDAASFAATNHLDLNKYRPDFVCISFYKLFGYPTGLGALIVSRRGERVLQKSYYGGGTVKIAMSGINWHRKRDCFHERFEDGTIPFLSIISVLNGLQTLKRLVSAETSGQSMQRISSHCFGLAQYLYGQLAKLKYSNGQSVIHFYHDTDFAESGHQGAIVNFNILHKDGSFVGFAETSAMASIHNIFLRTGCFCNPGACQRHLNLTNEELRIHYKAGHICGDSNDLIDGIPTGSVRISIGYMTTKANVDAVISFIVNCYVKQSVIPQLDKYSMKKYYKVDANKLRLNEPVSQHKIRLKQICVYPVKSCGAFKVSTKWPLTRKGLRYDREWMIVKSNGIALTQKGDTKLCLITPTINEEMGFLELSFPFMSSAIQVPLSISDKNKDHRNWSSSLCQSKVCGDRIEGIDCGDAVGEWLSDALCTDGLRLIRQSASDKRTFRNKQEKDSQEQAISLSNQAQFLLINSRSVEWLISKVEEWADLDANKKDDHFENVIDRFRGNLIVESEHVLEELKWSECRIGNVRLLAQGPCTRCQMICIDQRTGEKTTEPLQTIAHEFQGKMKFGAYFGQEPIVGSDNDEVFFIDCDQEIIIK